MADVADLWVTLRAETAPFRRGMGEAATTGESFTAKMGGIGGAMTKLGKATTLVGAGVAVVAVKMATDFQSATTRLVTSAGETNDKLDMVRKGMLSMAGQVGVSANDLAKAMYWVESGGFHAADGLTVLKAAAQGAAAEGADTTTVTQALTDVLKDYHMKASAAGDVTSKMITAVAHGKTTLQDYSAAFASIVPAASAAGISFNDVGAALSNMTNHGFTAQRASQNLAQALRSLLNPTKPMQTAFQDFGVSADTLRAKLHGPNGLTDAMQYLSQAATKAGKEGTPEFAAALKRLMGTAPGANAALSTVGANMKDTNDTIKAMAGSTVDANGKVKGFAEVQQTLGQKVKQLKAGFETLLIELGNKLIPIISTTIDFFTKHQTVTMALATAIGVVLAGAVVKFATGAVVGAVKGVKDIFTGVSAAAKAVKAFATSEKLAAAATTIMEGAQAALNAVMDANPIVLIIGALVLLGIAFYELWTHVSGFRNFWIGLWHDIESIATTVGHALQSAWNGIVAGVMWLWHHIVSIWNAIASVTTTVWNAIAGFFRKWWPLLLVIFLPVLAIIIAIWNHFHTQIESVAKTVWGAIKAFLKDVWDGIKTVAGAVWTAIKVVIVQPMEALWGWLKSLWHTVSGWLSSMWHSIESAASSLWTSIKNAMTGPLTSAWHAITSTVGHIASAISSGLHSAWDAVKSVGSWFQSIGMDIVNGIISGVEGAAGGLFSSLKNLASSALSSAKSFLGISSPSKLFRDEVGQWIAHGVAQGVDDNTHVAVRSVRSMAASVAGVPFGTAGVGSGLAVAAAGRMADAGPTVVNYITIQGSVLTERDLRDVVQREFLRLGARSSTTWQKYQR
ncbi:phage tail tape measure protein [Streptomyces sp. NPDC004232]|uniref:phage tail tape measure protein n=1 Tax=Streptomyces sp. NPDC004232 TaxID=3154454 RepID=UPI0033B06B08